MFSFIMGSCILYSVFIIYFNKTYRGNVFIFRCTMFVCTRYYFINTIMLILRSSAFWNKFCVLTMHFLSFWLFWISCFLPNSWLFIISWSYRVCSLISNIVSLYFIVTVSAFKVTCLCKFVDNWKEIIRKKLSDQIK